MLRDHFKFKNQKLLLIFFLTNIGDKTEIYRFLKNVSRKESKDKNWSSAKKFFCLSFIDCIKWNVSQSVLNPFGMFPSQMETIYLKWSRRTGLPNYLKMT